MAGAFRAAGWRAWARLAGGVWRAEKVAAGPSASTGAAGFESHNDLDPSP